jgi:hypothetical protein
MAELRNDVSGGSVGRVILNHVFLLCRQFVVDPRQRHSFVLLYIQSTMWFYVQYPKQHNT